MKILFLVVVAVNILAGLFMLMQEYEYETYMEDVPIGDSEYYQKKENPKWKILFPIGYLVYIAVLLLFAIINKIVGLFY